MSVTRDLATLPDFARLSISDLIKLTGASRASVYRQVMHGQLPQPHKLAPCRVKKPVLKNAPINSGRNYWLAGEVRQALASS